MQLLAEKIWCNDGGNEWINDKLPTLQCAEECKKKVGFINLIQYGRRDAGDSTCNQVGCDCKCVTGSCEDKEASNYDLYQVAESKLESVLSTLLT